MIGLAILLAVVWAYNESEIWEHSQTHPLIVLVIPALAGLVTWSVLIGLLVFVVYWLVLDPLLNLTSSQPFFYSAKHKWKDFFNHEAGLYDVIDGRIALMIESFIFIVLLFES